MVRSQYYPGEEVYYYGKRGVIVGQTYYGPVPYYMVLLPKGRVVSDVHYSVFRIYELAANGRGE